jgi:23S rRNA (cytidine2498-2'-O)-methyltransferase
MFNLKLPMKKRQEALESALNDIETLMQAHDIRYRLSVKQLYHDREEVTVYLGREARPRRNSKRR